MREMNPNLYPPGGYTFVERDGSQHRADGWKSLERKIVKYRTANGLEAGEPWREIMEQACGRSPGLCGETENRPKKGGLSFNQRILEWLAWGMARKRVNAWVHVGKEEAARRIEVCLKCPKQKSLNKSCGNCLVAVDKARAVLNGAGRLEIESLNPCGVLNEDVRVSVHAVLEPSNNPELPENCWRRS